MQGGDISNGTPPKFLVSLDLVVTQETVITKKFLRKPEEKIETTIDPVVLNALFRFANNTSCSLDVFGIGISQKEMNDLLEEMESKVVNPFRYGVVYKTLNELLRSIPYRVDVMGVMDLPGNALRYGSKFYDISKVNLGS